MKNNSFYTHNKEFSGIESEWPLFFALLVIDGVFKKDEEQVDKYQEKLRKHLSYNEYGGELLGQICIFVCRIVDPVHYVDARGRHLKINRPI